MTPEEKFNKDVQWVLEELQKEQIVSDGDVLQFLFLQGENVPSKRDQKRVIRWLFKKVGAIESFEAILEKPSLLTFHSFVERPVIGYEIKIDPPIFTALSKIYENDTETLSAREILGKAEKLGKAKKVDTSKPKEPKADNIPFLNEAHREIIFLDKHCEIPVGNQFELAKALFKEPVGTWIKENDVVHSFSRGEGKQSFYDAQRLLNERIKKDLGIQNLLEYQTAMVRINPKTIEKLNQSEK